MKSCTRVLLGVAVALSAALQAGAEPLRCNGAIVDEGEAKVSVLRKCGPPLIRDSFCAPVYYNGTPNPLPEPLAGALVPCQLTDEWLYDRGPGNLMATVRFRAGTVLSIKFGR